MQINTLGSLTITIDGEPLTTLNNRKAQALFVYLACQRGQQLSREHLQTLLWSDTPALKARSSLRQTLYKLQKAIPDGILQLHNLRIGIDPAAELWLDLDHVAADDTLYRGEFLQGFSLRGAALWDEWLHTMRETVTANLIEQWEKSAETHTTAHNYPTAVRYWQRVIELNAWREHPHRRLIELFLRMNDRAAAVAQYETVQALLLDELGVEPSAETQALYRRAVSAETTPTNLPHPHTLTPLVGRTSEIATLSTPLRDPKTRLITILGLGGSGKTRLAIAAARAVQDSFLDGTFLVDLTNGNAKQIATTIGLALGVQVEGRTPPDLQLIEHLRSRQLLLLLDNFETVIDTPAAITLVQTILHAAPDVTLLVTSRQRLRLRLEQVFPLAGLDVAVAAPLLFEQAARRASMRFSADPAPIAHICQLVEGLPLAIEMAAAWTPELSCADIAQEIARDLALMHSQFRDVPDRQRSLEVVFQQAIQRLDRQTSSLLFQLAAFRAGFSTSAVVQVTGKPAALLKKLVDRALLQQVDQTHYRLHERLRQFLRTAADPDLIAQTQQQHATHYLNWLGDYQETITGSEQVAIFERVTSALDNVLLAWQRAVEMRRIDLLHTALATLYYYLLARSLNRTSIEIAQRALPLVADERVEKERVTLHYRLLLAISSGLQRTGDVVSAEKHYRQALEIAARLENEVYYAQALASLGYLLVDTDQLPEAIKRLEEAAELYRESVQNAPNELQAVNTLGIAYKQLGRNEEARACYQYALQIAETSGNLRARAFLLNNMGVLLFDSQLGDAAEAYLLYEEALEMFHALDDRRMIGMTSGNIGNIHMQREQWDEARAWYLQGQTAIVDTGEQWVKGLLALNLGTCDLGSGAYQSAETHLHQAHAIFNSLHDANYLAMCDGQLARLAMFRTDVDDPTAARPLIYTALQHAAGKPPTQLKVLAEWGVYLARVARRPAQAAAILQFVLDHPITTTDTQAYALKYRPNANAIAPPHDLDALVATVLDQLQK